IDCLAVFASPFRGTALNSPFVFNHLRTLCPLFCTERQVICFFSMVCALFAKTWGVYPRLFFTPKAFSEGPNRNSFPLSSTASPIYSFFPLWTLCLCGKSLFPL